MSRTPQRLVDPDLCTACFGCFEVCPKGAVVLGNRKVAVDPALCDDCCSCVDECGTGAIDVIRMMPDDTRYSVDEQLGWDSLPPEEL